MAEEVRARRGEALARYRLFPRWERMYLKDVSTEEARFGLPFGRLYLLILENGLQRGQGGADHPRKPGAQAGEDTPG